MADASSSIAGAVTVEIGAPLAGLESGLNAAEAMVRAWDARIAGILSASGAGEALAPMGAAATEAAAALDTVAAPAVAAAAKLDAVAVSSMSVAVGANGAAVSNRELAEILTGTGVGARNLQAALAAQAATAVEAAEANMAAAAATTELGAAQAKTTGLTTGASVEIGRLMHALLTGQMGRAASETMTLGTRLGEAGAEALTFGNIVKSVTSFADVFLNPYVIGFFAIGGAIDLATKAFKSFSGGSDDVAEALKRQKQIVDDLTQAYPQLGKALKDALGQSPSATTSQMLIASKGQIDQAKAQIESLRQSLDLAVSPQSETSTLLQINPNTLNQIQTLVQDFDRGSISATSLSEKLANLELNPNIDGLTEGLLTNLVGITDQLAKAQINADAFTSSMQALRAQGGSIIGGDFSQLKSVSDLVDGLRKMAPDLRTPTQKAIDYYNQNSGLDNTGAGKQELDYVLQQDQLKQQADAAKRGARGASAFDSTLASITKETDGLNAQIATFGQSTSATEAAVTAQKLLDAAIQDHVKLTPALKQAIEDAADKYGDAKQKLDQMTAAQKAAEAQTRLLRDMAISASDAFASTFLSDLENGTSLMQSFADAASKALDDIAQKLINMAIENLWSNAFGGLTSGGGNWLTSLFGGGSTALASGAGLSWASAAFPAFASGTDSAPGGVALVGEKGPELVSLPAGARVSNSAQTAAMFNSAANSVANSNGISFQIGTIDARGAQAGVGAEIANALNGFAKNQLPNLVRQYNANPNRRGFVPYPTGG